MDTIIKLVEGFMNDKSQALSGNVMILIGLAALTIAIIGYLKAKGVFAKLPEKYKKNIMYGVGFAGTIFMILCWYLIAEKPFTDFAIMAVAGCGIELTLYNIYEAVGLKSFTKIALKWLGITKESVTNYTENAIKKVLSDEELDKLLKGGK